MASQQCLDVIQQGAAIWNHWRNNQEFIYLDLSEADLSHMDLRAIDLSGVYLPFSNLSNTNLSEDRKKLRIYLSHRRQHGGTRWIYLDRQNTLNFP